MQSWSKIVLRNRLRCHIFSTSDPTEICVGILKSTLYFIDEPLDSVC